VRLLAPFDQFRKCAAPPPYLTVEFLVKAPDATIKHVVPLLEDDNKALRRGAARVLAVAGPRAKNAASAALVKALNDRDDDVRVAVVAALGAVDPAAFRPAIPVLVKLLADGKFHAQEGAMILRSHDDEAFPLLIRALEQNSADEHATLVYTL